MLTGDRVTLRALNSEDYPALVRAYNDVELELLGGGRPPRPVTLPMVAEMFDEAVKASDAFTFAIEADAQLIGTCGLHSVNRVDRTAEIGIGIVNRDYHGRGYGREAMRLLLDFAFRLQNLRRVWLEVHGSNERAIRSYRASGFVEEGRLREHVWSAGRYDDLIQMGLLRREDREDREHRRPDGPDS